MVVIHNTLSGKKEEVKKSQKPLKLFVCGPTVYGPAHIGHARVEVVFDAAARYLRAQGYGLLYVQNITDVDDKIIERARAEKTTAEAIARVFLKEYMRDMKILRVTSVDRRARASEFMVEICKQIKRLIDKGYAYATSRGVYFEVRKFADYGKLSRQNTAELRPGWRIEPDPEKKDPLDFALWKITKADDEASWPSPWGRGRPGWHIEDTAITEKLLGQQYDIHGGGVDLKFPHHESEIAQQEAASGKKPFVKIWMHVGTVMAGEEKMAKSLSNAVEVKDFLDRHSVNTLRFLLLSSHYRSVLRYSEALAEQAERAVATMGEFIHALDFVAVRGATAENFPRISAALARYEQDFIKHMNDDFNTPAAFGTLFKCINDYQKKIWSINRNEAAAARNFLVKQLTIFGLMFKHEPIPAAVKSFAAERDKLRAAHMFKEADAIRGRIEELGYCVEDTPLGSFIKRMGHDLKNA